MTYDPFYDAPTLTDELDDEENETGEETEDDDISDDELVGPLEEEDPEELTPDFEGDE